MPEALNGPSSLLDPEAGRHARGRRYSTGWKQTGPTKKAAGPPMKLQGKTYDEIKAQCLKEGRLFEDPDFPAVASSLFYSYTVNPPFEWKRPTELVSDPEFISDGASRFDVMQGELGDCWLIAAVASLCQFPRLLARVVPEGQNFKDGYCGIFRFKFWRYGKWEEVVVDDRLPTKDGTTPVMMHSKDKKEFWTSLMEKAYAKLHGSYEALKGGSSNEAMEDFTGGVTEAFRLQEGTPSNLFKIMQKAFERESMMGCAIDARPGVTEARLANGLVMGHAYSVTGVKLIDVQTPRLKGKVPLVRIRNPWANEVEWKGAWSDDSPEWGYIDEKAKNEIGLNKDFDGEFWMSFEDFTQNFQKLEICNLGADSLSDDEVASQKKRRWECVTKEGSWIKRVNAGGCLNYQATYYTNPQYRFDVIDPDEDDDENSGTVLLALTQVGRRKRSKEGVRLLDIGYAVYKARGKDCLMIKSYKLTKTYKCVPLPLDAESGPLGAEHFKCNPLAKSGDGKNAFANLREMCSRHKLAPGQYVVLPCTFEPGYEGEFMLRIFTEKPITASELDEETGIGESWQLVPSKKQRRAEKQQNKINQNMATPEQKIEVLDQECCLESKTLGYSYQSAVQPTPPETDAEKGAKEAFKKIAGEDLEIDAYELKDILNTAFKAELTTAEFSTDTCRSLVAMKDCDRSGKLGYEEFKKLWTDLRAWKAAFKKFDADNSGNFNSYELRATLREIGITLSNQTFNSLVQRYCHKDGKMYFDDYIHCIARLTTMFDIFKDSSLGGSRAGFSLDQFIQTTMYS